MYLSGNDQLVYEQGMVVFTNIHLKTIYHQPNPYTCTLETFFITFCKLINILMADLMKITFMRILSLPFFHCRQVVAEIAKVIVHDLMF